MQRPGFFAHAGGCLQYNACQRRRDGGSDTRRNRLQNLRKPGTLSLKADTMPFRVNRNCTTRTTRIHYKPTTMKYASQRIISTATPIQMWMGMASRNKCNYLIAQGVAIPVGEGTRALKYAPTKTPIVKCFDDEPAAGTNKTAIAPKQQTNTTKKD